MKTQQIKTPTQHDEYIAHLHTALHHLVLLRETGPKSGAWHRARVNAIWRLHALMEQAQICANEEHTTHEQH